MATVQAIGWWTLLLGPAAAAAWATVRRRRRREPDRGSGAGPRGFSTDDQVGEKSETIGADRGHDRLPPGRRERAMRNLVGSIQNESIEADLRVQLIQDLVELGGHEMARRLAAVAEDSDVDIEVRLEAAEHMCRYSVVDGTRALDAIANDATVGDQHRLDAASALVDCAAGPAETALTRLVTDAKVSEYVRHAAANMLRRVDRGAAALAFGHLATSPLVTSRLRVICAEQLAADNPREAADALWRLINGVESSMDYNLGIDAAETLHGICPDFGLEAYSALAVDPSFSWWGRIEAAYRLGRLGVGDGFDLLGDFARAEQLDDVYGLAALDRLFQLESETGTLEPDE